MMKMHYRLVSLTTATLILLVLFQTSPAAAEQQTGKGIWTGFGLGKSSLGRPSIQMNLSVRSEKVLVGLRKTSSDGGSYRTASNDDSYDTMKDIGILVGRAWRRTRFHLSLATGVAGVQGTYHEKTAGDDDLLTKSDYGTTVGIPLESQLFWQVGGNVGLGLYGYLNFNKNRNFGGLCLSMVFGMF